MDPGDVIAAVSALVATVAAIVAGIAVRHARRSADAAERSNELTEQAWHEASAPKFEPIRGWFDDQAADLTLLLVDAPTRLWIRLDATAEWGMWEDPDGEILTTDIVFDPVLVGGTVSVRMQFFDAPESSTEALVMPLTLVIETYEEPSRKWTLNQRVVLRRRPATSAQQ